MTTFVRIRKDKYPYETLHTSTCGAVQRSYRAEYLSTEQVGRMDSRHDKCSRCMPRINDANGIPDGYSPAHLEFFRIQREYRDAEQADNRQRKVITQLVALELALEKVRFEAQPYFLSPRNTRAGELYAEYKRTMADGTFTPDELTVKVGNATITERPSRW